MELSQRLGFDFTGDLGKYLGVPIILSRVRKETYDYILTRVKNKLNNWKCKSLSLAGRITMAKSVIAAIPIYPMQATVLPSSICDEVERKNRAFIWGDTDSAKKIHLVSWHSMCQTKLNGGLGVVNSWKYVQEGAGWRLGSGMKVRFWSDPWLPNGRRLEDYAVVPLLDTDRNRVAAEFVSASGDWAWDKFDFLIPSNVSSMIAAVRPPSPMFPEDMVIWRHTHDGNFSTRSAYGAISSSDASPSNSFWKLLWKWKGMERVKTFLWLCGHDRLLTNEARKRRGLTDVDACCRCGMDVESLLHTLRDCRKVKPLWMKLVHPSHWHVFFGMGRMEWLEKNLSSSFGRSGRAWESVFAVAAWIFWKMRNAEVFQSHETEIKDPVNHVLQLVDSFTRAQSRLDTGLHKSHVSSTALICWHKAEAGWIKMNVDAARQEIMKKVACGGVARDCQGNVVAGFSRHIGDCSILVGELWAILHGLEVAWSLGIKKHVFREGNMVADACAKCALADGSDFKVFSAVPANAERWVDHDAADAVDGAFTSCDVDRTVTALEIIGLRHVMRFPVYEFADDGSIIGRRRIGRRARWSEAELGPRSPTGVAT
ncbi:putative ribonuclease H protein At1g65750 family [Senna tora]|uniref:Putative ribonuclease H protein At1g65750 family n=1 Tax=Senna tora TaxID=362788 RepID=A0A834XC53_9FABA|nr:putative ribonuclease H protein At1g65750 family [Senna tora]